jgi:hypothetical protein
MGALLMAALFLVGCPPPERTEPPDPTELPEYGLRLRNVHRRMLDDSEDRTEVDRKIAEAVEQLGATLWPDYKDLDLGQRRWRLGFLEISDGDRRRVTRFHRYLTEKILTFSFLEPEIATTVTLVERFTVNDVWRAASPPPYEIERRLRYRQSDRDDRYRHRVRVEDEYRPYRVIRPALARRLGRRYEVDLIETGVTTLSEDFVDLSLRMVETTYGRIVAVASVKIPRTAAINRWLYGVKSTGPVETGLEPDPFPYRFPDRAE